MIYFNYMYETMRKIKVDRLQPKFKKLVKDYMEKHGLNQSDIGKLLGLDRTTVNKLMKGRKDRPLTAYYISIFLREGIFKVKDIYDENPENAKELDFWDRAKEAENWELLRVVSTLRKHGIDATEKLKSIYSHILDD
jgi:DNA-binding XRE family transcriptional regulator